MLVRVDFLARWPGDAAALYTARPGLGGFPRRPIRLGSSDGRATDGPVSTRTAVYGQRCDEKSYSRIELWPRVVLCDEDGSGLQVDCVRVERDRAAAGPFAFQSPRHEPRGIA